MKRERERGTRTEEKADKGNCSSLEGKTRIGYILVR